MYRYRCVISQHGYSPQDDDVERAYLPNASTCMACDASLARDIVERIGCREVATMPLKQHGWSEHLRLLRHSRWLAVLGFRGGQPDSTQMLPTPFNSKCCQNSLNLLLKTVVINEQARSCLISTSSVFWAWTDAPSARNTGCCERIRW
jgi:hypothetical protein